MNDYKRRLRALAGAPGQPKAQLPAAEVADGVATMRLYDPIDSWGEYWGVSAKEFAQALDDLPSNVTEIRLHINSPGGDVFDGVAIVNSLRSHPARVVAVVDGIAASAASFIATAADETIMAPNSEMMIHDAWGLCVGNAAEMRQMAETSRVATEIIAKTVVGLAKIEDPKAVLANCIEINRLENDADRTLRSAMAKLFREETNAIEVIKKKEIYQLLESITDKCEDVANVIEGIVMEYS